MAQCATLSCVNPGHGIAEQPELVANSPSAVAATVPDLPHVPEPMLGDTDELREALKPGMSPAIQPLAIL